MSPQRDKRVFAIFAPLWKNKYMIRHIRGIQGTRGSLESNGSKPKGQISIMIVLMITTLFLYLAFIINVGMLVNAKINLQNAADLAAYAGAAVQARQLNNISYLNYEMRRQWKKLIFRLYVLGNMAMDTFPRTGGQPGPMVYQPNQNSGTNYGVPVTCIAFNPQNDNYCHISSLPAVSIPPANFLDAITQTLRGQLQLIEAARQSICVSIGETNKFVNLYWLFNTDPTLQNIQGLQADQANITQAVQALAQGLGIVPRETILSLRIQTLQDYVNAGVQTGLDFKTTNGLTQLPDPSLNERSIQAFYSAYYTLGNHTFAANSIFLDELLPGTSQQSQMLNLVPIQVKFDTYAIDYPNIGNNNFGQSPSDCTAQILPVIVQLPLTVGYYKDQTILTYYAVRVRATAQLLFSPFGNVDLSAYAAARPFGSRIGPSQPSFFAADVQPNGLAAGTLDITRQLPNLPVVAGDGSGMGSGWDTQNVVGTMFSFLMQATGGPTAPLSGSALHFAYQVAMAPNPSELGQYNIPNDLGNDPFEVNFGNGPAGINPEEGLMFIWAPIVSPAKTGGGGAGDVLQQAINNMLSNNPAAGNMGIGQSSDAAFSQIKDALIAGLQNYVGTQLPNGQGEDESMNIVRIHNPFKWINPTNSQGPQLIGGGQLFQDPTVAAKTSWNQMYNGSYQSQGRTGYSVKFVSFQSLLSGGQQSGISGSQQNGVGGDSEASIDMKFIQH